MVVGEPHWHLYAQKDADFQLSDSLFHSISPFRYIYILLLLIIIIITIIIIIYKAYKHLGKYLNLCWT